MAPRELSPSWRLENELNFLYVGLLCIVLITFALKSFALRRKMPPGPSGIPFIGNRHQMPARKPWRKFEQLNKIYGPVVSLFFGSTPIIVLGTAQAAWDLLEKRSDKYSSRPRFIMSGEILSDNMRGLMLPNNEEWRKWRKILHTGFHLRQAQKYRVIQSLESKVTMQQIVENPEEFEKYIQRYAASVVVSVTYGRRVESVDEWIVAENAKSMACKRLLLSMDSWLNTSCRPYEVWMLELLNCPRLMMVSLSSYSVNIPGKYVVESWPWLLKLPKCLQWFRREPEAQKERDVRLLNHLVADVKQRMKEGTVPDCLTVEALQNQQKIGVRDLFLAYSMSTPFGAGIETTAGTIMSFILAMLHFPGVMRKAQAEIDSVLSADHMPEYEDYDSLPYIVAVVNEALRWRPVAVLGGTPHASTADDMYNDMFIPKGSTVFANFWGIMRDPVMFPEPDKFEPERFINSKDPRLTNFELPFGFGRRICPGMHLARNSVFINIARLLWAFDILPALDKNGKEIIPDSMDYTDGFNSKPVSFDCRLIPRSEKVIETIKTEYDAAQSKFSNWSW
ncbi:hypothetical protein ACEPAI_2453 [Sanghuangporus weigelae]